MLTIVVATQAALTSLIVSSLNNQYVSVSFLGQSPEHIIRGLIKRDIFYI